MMDPVSHWETLQSCIQNWTKGKSDLRVICEDGRSVYTHTVLFGLFSLTYRNILLPVETRSSIVSVSVPASLGDVTHLIEILMTGCLQTGSAESSEKLEDLAELLGMSVVIDQNRNETENVKEVKGDFGENNKDVTNVEKVHMNDQNRMDTDDVNEFKTYFDLNMTAEVNVETEHIIKENTVMDIIEDLPNYDKTSTFNCTYCNKGFPSKVNLIKHIDDHSSIDKSNKTVNYIDTNIAIIKSENNICGICTKYHRPDDIHDICTICQEKFVQKVNKKRISHLLNKHLISCHGIKKEISIKTKKPLCKECKKHHSPVKTHDSCPHCQKKFVHEGPTNYQILRHIQNIHNIPQVKISSRNKQDYDPENNLHCHICKISNDLQTTQIWHEDKHAQDNEDSQRTHYKCRFCNYVTTTQYGSRLKLHLFSHTGEKPEMCKDCGQTFKTPNNLRNHERTHSNLLNYKCEYCSKKFNQPGGLYYHKKNQHKETKKNSK